MSFAWPAMLVFLALVPLFVVHFLRTLQRRRRLAAQYGTLGLVHTVAGHRLGLRRHLPPGLYLVGLTILIVALARPQAVVSIPRIEGTVILAFDVSGSMAADDLKPTRMEAAKAAVRDFVQRQPSTVRIGVVAFSDSGFATQAPTNDQAAILTAIERLAPQRGTSLGRGIEAALNTIAVSTQETPPVVDERIPPPARQGADRSALMVLLSDGENTAPPDPLAAAQAAADRGIRISTVGIGSAEGAPLEVEGFTVHTRLDEATLRQIADLTGGTYYNAANEEDLRTIYDTLDAQLVTRPEEIEVTSLFAGAGVLILLIGAICSLLWLGRVP